MPGGQLTKAQAEEMAPIGNSPTFLSLATMKTVMPLWANVSVEVFKDKSASEARGARGVGGACYGRRLAAGGSARSCAHVLGAGAPPRAGPCRALHASAAPRRRPRPRAQKWGWVQEMYAFTISLWRVGVKRVDLVLHLMAQPPWDSKLEVGAGAGRGAARGGPGERGTQAAPGCAGAARWRAGRCPPTPALSPANATPQLSKGKPYCILHYTYGNDFDLGGKFTPGAREAGAAAAGAAAAAWPRPPRAGPRLASACSARRAETARHTHAPRARSHTPGKYGRWRFDKRTYASRPPPRHLGAPPAGMRNDMVRALVASINEATAAIPCWDAYAASGVAPRPCSEAIPPRADGFQY